MRRPRPVRWARRQWRERPVVAVAVLLFLATFAGFVRVEQVRTDGEEHLRGESERRAAAVCEGTNRALAGARSGLDRFRQVLIAVATEGDPETPEQRDQIDAFNRRFDREVLAGLDPVDCESLTGD